MKADAAQSAVVADTAPLRRPAAALLWLAPLALYCAHAWLFRDYINDDAYITFRYSRSLAEGLGPYFNPGEHVEGYTNFLLMLLLSALAWLAGAAVLPAAAKALGLLCGAAAVVLAGKLAARLSGETEPLRAGFVAMLAGALVAASPGYALNSMSGLETALYGALVALGVLLGESRQRTTAWLGPALAFGAALLTRPEGAVIFAAYWLARVACSWRAPERGREWRELIACGAVVTAIFAAQLLFRLHAYDGEWLPNTYYAKQLGAAESAWNYVRRGAFGPFGGVLAFALAALAVFVLPGSRRLRLLPVAAPALIGAFLPFLTGTDWMEGYRFSAPYLPLLAVLVGIGWMRALGAIRLPQYLRWALPPVLVAMLWLAQAGDRASWQRYIEFRAEGYRAGHRQLAQWLKAHASAGDTVALMDIGIVGFELPQQRILDTSGLTDRFIAKSPGGFLDKQYDPAYVLDQAPRFIVVVFSSPLQQLMMTPGTAIERRLFESPGFQKDYVRREPEASSPGVAGLVQKAVGADQVFLHAHPDFYYFLAVYERRPAGRGSVAE